MPRTTDHGATIDPIEVDDDPYGYPPYLDWLKYSNVSSEAIGDDEQVLNWSEGSPVERTIVAGSRSITDVELVRDALRRAPREWLGWVPSEIVHGGADGVDSCAHEIAMDGVVDIVTVFEPRWEKFCPLAGPERNREMAQYADNLVAVWDGKSSGTRSMIDEALDQGLGVFVVNVGHRDL